MNPGRMSVIRILPPPRVALLLQCFEISALKRFRCGVGWRRTQPTDARNRGNHGDVAMPLTGEIAVGGSHHSCEAQRVGAQGDLFVPNRQSLNPGVGTKQPTSNAMGQKYKEKSRC